MAFSEWQLAEIKLAADKYLGKRNEMIGEHIDQVKCEYKIEGSSIIIYEHRKQFQGEGYFDFDVAKATWRQKTGDWKLFWKRRDDKWHGYEPEEIHKDINSVFDCVDSDQYGCLWG